MHAFAQNLKRARLLKIYNHPFKKLQSEMKDHDLEDVSMYELQKSHGDFLHKLCNHQLFRAQLNHRSYFPFSRKSPPRASNKLF